MSYLLDTNICIKYLNGHSDNIRKNIELKHPQDIMVCSVVKAELFYGSLKSLNPTRNLEKQQRFVNRFVSLPFDDRAASVYSRIRAQLEKSGTPIGPNDLLIASIALANDQTLITHNTREFARVDNLKIEDWEN